MYINDRRLRRIQMRLSFAYAEIQKALKRVGEAETIIKESEQFSLDEKDAVKKPEGKTE